MDRMEEYYKTSHPDIVDEVQKKYLDEARQKTSDGSMTYAMRNFFWKIFNQTLRGQVTPADETEAWEKIYQNSEASAEAKELVENARSATQENRERQLRVNDFVAFIVLIVVVVFLFYFFCRIFYIKVLLPFLDWCEKVAIWFENNQTAIFLLGVFVVAVLISLKIFPIIRTKK